MEALAFRLCRLIKRIILFIMKNPHLPADSETADRLRRRRYREPKEFKEYQDIWTQSYWSIALVCSCNLAFMSKIGFIVFHLIRSADHTNPENNIVPVLVNQTNIMHGKLQYRFNCLVTNCSQPIGGRESFGLGHDMKRLPHLWLCRPELTQWGLYSPLDMLDVFTILDHATMIIVSLALCVCCPIMYSILSRPNEQLMFTVAPKLTTSLVLDRLISYYRDLEGSYLNFRAISVRLSGRSEGASDTRGLLASMRRAADVRRQEASDCSLYSAHLPLTSAERLEEYARDCLPVTRTSWWCQELNKLTAFIYITLCVCTSVVMVLFVSFYLVLAAQLRSSMAGFKLEMRRQRCAIWKAPDLEHPAEFVDITKPLLIGYSYYVLLESGFCLLMIVVMVGNIFTTYLTLIIELNFWLQELRIKLLAATEILRFRSIMEQSGSSPAKDLGQGSSKPEFRMGRVRDRVIQLACQRRLRYLQFSHKDLARALLPGDIGRPTRSPNQTDTRLGHQIFAARLMEEHAEGAHVEYVEKVYLSFRLFMEVVSQYGQVVAPLIFFWHSLIYLLAAMTVYFTCSIKDFSFEPMAMAGFLVLIACVFINFGAAFHSKATRLMPLAWSLVAQISTDRDPRLDHLRLLWLKLADMIDCENGIYLKALGVSFNYLNIVQLTVGTGTIVILSLKD